MTNKKCCKCKNPKPITEFYTDKRRKDGIRNECKLCTCNMRKKYYKSNTKIEKTRYAVWQATLKGRYSTYKRNAKQKNREWKLSLKEFDELTKKNCVYCDRDGYGIDRIDSSLGYILSNCVSCCSQCNTAKMHYSTEEFIDMCKRVVQHHENRNTIEN